MQNSIDHTQNIIEINNLSFGYNNEEVLESVSLKIHKGDYLALTGPNGGGKTTLLKCIIGLLKPKKGTIKLFNQDFVVFKEWSHIGYVPQKVNFDPKFPSTAREVVAMGLYGKKGLFKQLDKKDWEDVDQAIERVGMQNFATRLIGNLSGGQQQRILIARSLVANPEVIFLDEPTVGVDMETRDQFFSLLQTLNENLELTLVLITHDMDIILHHGVSEVAFLNRKVLFYGTPKDLSKTKYIDEHYNKHIY